MMSTPTCRKRSGSRRCSMLASEPVSRLSTQMTRFPRASSSSHRCEPRNPAPPVTRQVATLRRIPEPPAPRHGPVLQAHAPAGRRVHIIRYMAIVGASDNDQEEETVAPIVGPDDPRRFTDSGIEIAELYSEADLPEDLDLGEPGEFPYTRGVHREMY